MLEKTIRSSSKRVNGNACDQKQTNRTSHLESIDSSIIDELKGSEYDHIKQPLLTSSVPRTTTTTTISNSLFPRPRRSFKEVLADLQAFDCHLQRQFRTVGVGDQDINENRSTADRSSLEVNDMNDGTEVSTIAKRKAREKHSSQTKQTPNVTVRTICTRSSTQNALKDNEEQQNLVLPSRIRKRRLLSRTQTHFNSVDNTTKTPDLNISQAIDEIVLDEKLQSSLSCSPTTEWMKTINDF